MNNGMNGRERERDEESVRQSRRVVRQSVSQSVSQRGDGGSEAQGRVTRGQEQIIKYRCAQLDLQKFPLRETAQDRGHEDGWARDPGETASRRSLSWNRTQAQCVELGAGCWVLGVGCGRLSGI